MTVLITRPEFDALQTASLFRGYGIPTHINPLMRVEYTNSPPAMPDAHHIIFTSKNGVRAYIHHYKNRDLNAWCVGDKTADEATNAGFRTVHSADGNNHDLNSLIRRDLLPCVMARVMGDMACDPLNDVLTAHGFTVMPMPLYSVRTNDTLSPATLTKLRNGDINGVAIYSPRSSIVLAKALTEHGCLNTCRSLTAWCISNESSAPLTPLPLSRIVVARAPNQAALLDEIRKDYTHYGD